MKMKRHSNIEEFGKKLGVSPDKLEIIKIKTKLKKRITAEANKQGINNTELAELSGLSRSAVSGIINGSLQSVSVERLIKLAMALDLTVSLTIKKVA